MDLFVYFWGFFDVCVYVIGLCACLLSDSYMNYAKIIVTMMRMIWTMGDDKTIDDILTQTYFVWAAHAVQLMRIIDRWQFVKYT